MATLFLYFLVFLALYAITIHFLNKIRNFPPSPYPSLPIIGHLYLLKKPIYRTLSKISSKHGPVILLQQGSRRLLVVSSPSIAEECFTKNDVVFANRPRLLIAKHLAYNSTSLGWAPYGDHWRNLRKIASIEVLSAYRLQMLSAIRLEEVKAMICGLFRKQNQLVDMKTVFFELTLNIMMRMIAGKRYYGENVSDVEEAKRFQAIHAEAFLLSGKTIIGDYIPWIKSKKMVKRLVECHIKRDNFMQYLIEEQRTKIREGDCCGEKKRNLIQVLLSLQETEPEYYTDDIIKGLMMIWKLVWDATALRGGTDIYILSMDPAFVKKLAMPNSQLYVDPSKGSVSYDNFVILNVWASSNASKTRTVAINRSMAALFLYFPVFLALYAITRHFLERIENFPPTPFPSLPIIGHLYLLIKKPIYRTLSKISSKHGPVILLQQGSRRLLVVSSPSIAQECFTKNDVIFANRPRLLLAKHLAYNHTTLAWASYGDHWRNLRKIASVEVLSAYRLQTLSSMRVDEVKSMICGLFRNQNQIVEMKTVFFEQTLNIMMGMIAGKRYYGDAFSDVEEAKRFRAIHAETSLLSGQTIIGDYLPWIKSKKMEKRLMECQIKRDRFMQYLIEQQRRRILESDSGGEKKRNLIQVLLSLKETEPEYYTDDIIKGLMLVRFLILLLNY
ncbi:hypothetical protein DKX38_020481 [Salix brachista]|uniref:Cytochrome P450 n=1 Tax=Salix brachista TaxID=2182728 RepID=A0A5N5K881_9ROSI|nr:hypothetical protein DKX38_020481 [Salix brachista]